MNEIEKQDALVEQALSEIPIDALLLKEDLKSLYKKGLLFCWRGESGEFYWRLTSKGKELVELLLNDEEG